MRASDWAHVLLERDRSILEGVIGPGRLPVNYPHDILGCGVFGCVYELPDPEMVLKVTTDGSEAFLAEVLRQFGPQPGLCSYSQPIRTTTPVGPAWYLWRSRVDGPNLRKSVERDPREFLEGCSVELSNAHECLMSIAGFISGQAGSGRWFDVAEAMTSELQWAADNFQYEGSWSSNHYVSKRFRKGLSEPRYHASRFLGAQYHLQRAALETSLKPLCESVLNLMDQGVLVCDIQADNVGMRRGKFVAFDGGFTVAIDRRWQGLWEKVGVMPGRWWRRGAPWERQLGDWGELGPEESEALAARIKVLRGW